MIQKSKNEEDLRKSMSKVLDEIEQDIKWLMVHVAQAKNKSNQALEIESKIIEKITEFRKMYEEGKLK